MSFSRKMILGVVITALVGTSLGVLVGVSISDRGAPSSAPVAELTSRREAPRDEVAMVSTRPAPEAPRAGLTTAPAPRAVVAEAERLPSPALVREARQQRVDGSRASEGLRVRRLLVATGVDDREPVGASDTFDGENPRLYAFVDLANRGDETQVEVSFEPDVISREARVTGLVTLEVPGEVGRHRTWAWSRGVRAPGRWAAVVRDLEGHELARTPFTIE